jgi:transcriptional regulator with XRE-family HTH domain
VNPLGRGGVAHPAASPPGVGVWENLIVSDPHRELGLFLQNARASRDPDIAGLLPDGRIRRVPGLRREEFALLAGVSTDYYTRIEQGRHIVPSTQVINAFIRALDLDEAGQSYLHILVAAVGSPLSRSRRTAQRVRPALHQLLDSFTTQPALVLGQRTDILASNSLARALFADFNAMPAKQRNYARWILLDPDARTLFVDWEDQAHNAVDALRLDVAGSADDKSTPQLIGELSLASPEFRQWWSQHRVHQRTHGTKRLRHPVVGALEVQFETLRLPGENGQALYLYTAEPATPSADALALLGTLGQAAARTRGD